MDCTSKRIKIGNINKDGSSSTGWVVGPVNKILKYSGKKWILVRARDEDVCFG